MIAPEVYIGLSSTYTEIPIETIRTIKQDTIDQVVCRHYGTKADDIKHRSRRRFLVEPRQICMTLRMVLLGHTQHMVGLTYRLDHATALHAKRSFCNIYDTDKTFRERIWSILKELGVKPVWFEELLNKCRIKNLNIVHYANN
jgi:chromosomal replication initiation ATPase DnaA